MIFVDDFNKLPRDSKKDAVSIFDLLSHIENPRGYQHFTSFFYRFPLVCITSKRIELESPGWSGFEENIHGSKA